MREKDSVLKDSYIYKEEVFNIADKECVVLYSISVDAVNDDW